MHERIKQLEQFIEEDRNDPFNFYALGLEYLKIEDRKALPLFIHLIEKHSTYLPTYYQLAKLYEHWGEKEKAIKIYEDGISVAGLQHEIKTLNELRAGLNELIDGD